MASPFTVMEALLNSNIQSSVTAIVKLGEKPSDDVESYWWAAVGDPETEQFAERQFPKGEICDIGKWVAETACQLYPGSSFAIAYRHFQAPPFNYTDPVAALVAGV